MTATSENYAAAADATLVQVPSSAGEAGTGAVGWVDAAALLAGLKELMRLGNEVKLRTLELMSTLDDSRQYYELGYSTFAQFCEVELGLGRSTVFERLRAARALDRLPSVRMMFGAGELSWQQVRAITRVATTESEQLWIELAWRESMSHLEAQVRAALRNGRTAPRDKRYGLPNLTIALRFDVTLEERERIRAVFTNIEALLGELPAGWSDGPPSAPTAAEQGGAESASGSDLGLDPDIPGPRPALVRFADAVLAGRVQLTPVGRGAPKGSDSDQRRSGAAPEPRPTPAQTVVYHLDVATGAATVDTDEGPVRISAERITALAPLSNRVDLPPDEDVEVVLEEPGAKDAPNTAKLTNQVRHRDGLRCAVPGCGRRDNLQAHHVKYRSKGGRSLLQNEVLVCDRCHRLIHEKLLDVTGSPSKGWTWRRVPADPAAQVRDVARLEAQLHEFAAALPAPTLGRASTSVLPQFAEQSPAGDSPELDRDTLRARESATPGGEQSPAGDSPTRPAHPPRLSIGQRVEDLTWGLVRMGKLEHRAREHVLQAFRDLGDVDDGTLFLYARKLKSTGEA